MEGVLPEDPLEQCDESPADVQDAGHEAVGFSCVEQGQDDPHSDDDLDQPEPEDDDSSGQLGAPGAGPGDVTTVRLDRFLTRGRGRFLSDDPSGRLGR